jgi:hypothetical protein
MPVMPRLLSAAVLQVKKTTFNNSPPDKAYGAVLPPDAEGARAGQDLF